jgi:hypothetical protein
MKYEDLPLIDATVEVDGKTEVVGKEIDPKKLDDVIFPVTFTFKSPLPSKNIVSTEIREPTIGDIESAQKENKELDQNKKLLSLVGSNLSLESIDEIVPRDFTKLLILVTPFLG